MFLSRTDEIRAISEASLTPAEGYETGFFENFNTTEDAVRLLDTNRSQQDAIIKVLEPFVESAGVDHNPGFFRDALNGSSRPRATGRLRQFDEIDEASMPEAPFYEYRMRLQKMNAALEAQGKPTISEEQVNEKAREIALKARADQQDISSRSTTMGDVGSLLGGAYSEIRSLLRSPAAPSLVAGASIKAGILKTALVEGVIGASQVALAQPDVAKWYGSLGLKYTSEDFQRNVFSAFIGGAAFGGLIKGAIKGAPIAQKKFDSTRAELDPVGALGREISKQVDETSLFEVDQALRNMSEKDAIAGLKALEKAGVPINNEAAAVIRQVASDDADENPLLGDGLDAQAEHLERELAVELALDADEIPVLTDKPAIPPKVPDDINHYDNLDDTLFRVDFDEVEVDARTFQFKGGGDAEGVIQTLQGIDTWDPMKAGTIIVYENSAGRQFVADGHQRLGLAKRIKAANPDADINLYGFKLKEADGITPDMARVIAAMVNISQGSGTVIDAAKVLRVDPSKIAELPPMSQMVRQARDLVNLSDENFGMVVNEIVPSNYAAIVGRLVDDPGKQNAILRILAETNPSNVTQAEAIVRQAREIEFREATQDGLFGTEEFTQSLFAERAKVLDATLKRLRNDKKVFNSLVENQNRIEAEGNQLDADSNISRSMTDGQALEIIAAQADRKGGIADALNLAARELADGRPLTEVSRNVADAVRRAIADGDIDGSTVSLEGRGIDVEAEADRLAAGPERLDEFDEPNGKGSQDQADASEATLREETEITEAAQPDEALREDLGRIVDEGATPEQIEAHPAVTDALERAMAIPLTKEVDGYGGDAWRAGREFRFGDETVVGYEAGVQRLYENAKRLGWEDDKKTFPGQIDQGRRATIMLGPPASGKSYFANKVAQARKAAIVDSDEAKKVLPEYDGGIGANAVHAESTLVAELVMREVIAAGDNVVIPRTGRTVAEIETTINLMKDAGYEVDIILMQVSADTVYRRMISRFIKEGRLIPPDYIRAVGDNPRLTYNAVKSKADRYATIENESPIDSAKGVLDEGPDSPLQDVDLRLRRGSSGGGQAAGRVGETERTLQGEQTLIEGVTPITDATRAQAAVDAPLTGGARPMDEGLFDTGSRAQMDLLDMAIPVGQRIDDAGELVAETQSVRDILTEFDNDKSMLDRLKDCV